MVIARFLEGALNRSSQKGGQDHGWAGRRGQGACAPRMLSGDASPGARRHYSSETNGFGAHDGHDEAMNALAHDCRHHLHASSLRFRDRGDYPQILSRFNTAQEAHMPNKRRKAPAEHPIEKILRAVSTIGQLEIVAGIDRSPEGRKAFWNAYKHINPPGASFDAGCQELRRLARQKAGLKPPYSGLRPMPIP
jgi:hypothetical protein